MEANTTKKISGLITLALGLILINCTGKEADTSEAIEVAGSPETGLTLTQAQFETMQMEWGSPVMEEFSEDLKVQGMIKVPIEGMQTISAYFGGYVSGMRLLEGQAVRKGEVLFYLENPEFIRLQQDYLDSKSQLAYLKADFERQKTLYSEQIAAQKNYLKAEADYQSTLAKAESLKKQLAMININVEELKPESIKSRVPVFSPISGFVESIHVVPGAFLPASEKAVSIISKSHLHVELSVFEKDAIRIKKGQKVSFYLPDMPSKKYMAVVFVVGQSINEQRFVNVHAELADESQAAELVPGMFVDANIGMDPQQGWSLPSNALIETEDGYYVLVQKSKTDKGFELEKILVKVGRQTADRTEILPVDGIKESTVILVKGGFNLL
ncbi:MAG: efflux RND transporter periplasmic adaptor subunit [Algoriphagus sp.]|nr:efflux RND transporter periplasmic adaptor subunit [Algoriphagus sp.]